ncbi:MAG: FkbM family methyltransferase [Candidatus Aminicenantes bacterium]|nr:FkbM family methyltransferase [Candidatus Aminicenantes bacterium]
MILNNLIKALLFNLGRPRHGQVKMTVGGEEARFFARNYEQLRYLKRFSDEEGINEARILRLLLEVLKPRDTVYDIGANIGTHTVFIAKRIGPSGQVISFEPDSDIAQILEGHVRLNRLKNVTVFRLALGNREYEGDLFVDEKIGRGSTSLIATDGKTFSGRASVVRGDRIVAEKRLPVPRAVKIDVEGYEIEVLEGLERTLRHDECSYLCCEIHPALLPQGRTQSDVFRIARGLGFSPMGIYPRGREIHTLFGKSAGPGEHPSNSSSARG